MGYASLEVFREWRDLFCAPASLYSLAALQMLLAHAVPNLMSMHKDPIFLFFVRYAKSRYTIFN